jgi:hypothetical protein
MYRPWVNRKFGIELEMNDVATDNTSITETMLRNAVSQGLVRAGQPAARLNRRDPGYYQSNGQTWDVKTDASCGYNNRTGWEVAAPAMVLDDEGECVELKEVTNALKLLKPRIDKKCGLHVHVEVRDYNWRDLRNLLVLWARYEPFAFELCPPSRRSNVYCPPFRKTEWSGRDGAQWTRMENGLGETTEQGFQRIMQMADRGAVNLTHFWRSKRVEFRLGGGTIEYEKIVRWTQFLLSFVNRVKRADMPIIQSGGWSNAGFSTLYVFKMLGLAPSKHVPEAMVPGASTKLLEWCDKRRAQFQQAQRNPIDAAVAAGARADANAGRSVR